MDLAPVWDATLKGGPWVAVVGLVIAGIRAIVAGQLVPRSTVDVLVAQWQDRLDEAHKREEQWREAYRNEAAAGTIRDGQITRLMTYAETADRVLQSLPRKDPGS